MDSKTKQLIEIYEKAEDAFGKASIELGKRFQAKVHNIVANTELSKEERSDAIKRIMAQMPDMMLQWALLGDFYRKGWIDEIPKRTD